MSNISDEEIYALFFKMMANKDRLRIMASVKSGAKTVSQICDDTGFEQTWVSHSLKKLRDGGIVESKREGKYIYYKLDGGVKPIIEAVQKAAPKYKKATGGSFV
ncbi:winged helix-turn-helix transcriptional regulator [Candidatus Woesearchaeota archaeon]|nr:winged helix-turn-helix transcriptional regulator [Candidatus Woesearchaeota archaeon]